MEKKVKKVKAKKKIKGKKLLSFLVIGIFALALVSAGVYYALLSFNVIVNQPISIYGDGLVDIACDAGSTCVGDAVTISNDADEDRLISVNVGDSSDDLTTGIVGEVILSEKDTTTWANLEDKAIVDYTIVGDKFNYKVDSSLDLEDYVLIYYLDKNSAKDWNIDNAVLIGDADSDWTTLNLIDLPIGSDYNIGADPDYCDMNNGFDDYLHCNNAKLWLMPESDWNAKNWNPTAFLFETDLITYTDTTSGVANILVPAEGSVNVYPQVTIDKYALGGTYPITVTVA